MKKRLYLSLLCVFAGLLLLAVLFSTNPSSGARDPGTIRATEASEGQYYRKHRSSRRENYPHLTDEEFANFRCVATTGMGRGALYRSSSPVDPSLKRNRFADDALRRAGIRTVLNLADSRKEMEAYEGYADTAYSGLDICPLNMSQRRTGAKTREKLARAFRYIISHDGPWLVHCTLGRDRTGFTCAVLECLMGASADEIVEDYMLSYYDFYGMEPGMAVYDRTSIKICRELASVFRIQSIYSKDIDLARCANDYLLGLGLTGEEIAALKERLGTDLT